MIGYSKENERMKGDGEVRTRRSLRNKGIRGLCNLCHLRNTATWSPGMGDELRRSVKHEFENVAGRDLDIC